MNKRVLSVITMLALSVTLNSNVMAAQPSNNESDALKQTQEDKKNIQGKIQNLNGKIQDVLKQIDSNKKEMNKVAADMKNTENRLDYAKNNLNSQQDLFEKRVRSMYMNGTDSYINIIFSSKSLSDFAEKANAIATVIKFDNNVIGNVKEERETINKQKQTLTDENNKISALKQSNETILASLSNDMGNQKTLLDKTTKKEQTLLAAKQAEEERQKQQAAAAAAAAAAANKNNSKNSSSTQSSGSIQSFKGQPVKTLTMVATGYSTDGFTAMGTQTVRNPGGYSTVAVDPTVIPSGSKLYIEGYGYAVADDTGGAIIGNRIDLFFSTEADANNWGVQSVTVHILN